MDAVEDVVIRFASQKVQLSSAGRIYGKSQWRQFCNSEIGCSSEICLYAFFDDTTLLYVGESVNVAEKSRGTGAKVHDWRRLRAGQEMHVFVFSCPTPPSDVLEIAARENIENPKEVVRRAIEAEVVFRFREQTGRLPIEQHEIHFQPKLFEHPFVQSCADQISLELVTVTKTP